MFQMMQYLTTRAIAAKATATSPNAHPGERGQAMVEIVLIVLLVGILVAVVLCLLPGFFEDASACLIAVLKGAKCISTGN